MRLKITSFSSQRQLAIKIQRKLAKKVKICPCSIKTSPLIVGAADVGFKTKIDKFRAAVVVFEIVDSKITLIDEAIYEGKASSVKFPYIPGLLAFREVPLILKAYRKLSIKPSVMLCDGQGIAHPRGIGLASHLGLILKLPTIGCAKSKLCGHHEELPHEKGSLVELIYKGKPVGVVYRSKTNVKPIYISPGHLIDIPSSVEVVKLSLGRFRIPEPLRKAHQLTVT